MTSYALPIIIGEETNNFNYTRWLKSLLSPTIRVAGQKDELINAMANNRYFLEEVERTRRDFMRNLNNTQKYPKLNESDWE